MHPDNVVIAAFAVANQWRIDAVSEEEHGRRKWTISFCSGGLWSGEEELSIMELGPVRGVEGA